MISHKRPRMIVLGLDGLPHSLAKDLTARHDLPGIKALLQMQASHPIRSDLPELSPVNWTSFYTASGPETHGIFGFTELDPKRYTLYFTDSTQVRCESVFDELGREGRFCKIINLPGTYPAWPVHGILVSGFPAPELSGAVHPKIMGTMLASEGYKLEADTRQGRLEAEHLFSELHATLRSRQRALELFWPDLAFDLFVLVLTEMDRMGHFFFPSLRDENDPWHGHCLEVVHRMDRLLQEVLERYEALPEPKRLLALADHGFAELATEVDVNAWLNEAGLLHLQGEPESETDASVIGPGSKALALDPGRIVMHRADRFAKGSLSPAEASSLREEIADALSGLTRGEEPVFEDVLRGEDIYPDCPFPHMPDLVCLPSRGYDLKAKFNRGDVFGHFGRTGAHTADDAFFADSSGADVSTVRQTGQEMLNFFRQPQNLIIT
ncbi:MAG: alkaline phosphatase family protein [Desulfohalobiaceae bacterium]